MPYASREKRNSYNRTRYAALYADDPVLRRQHHQLKLRRLRQRQSLQEPTRPMPSACELCGHVNQKRALCYDHSHETKLFRGWICQGCNLAIGRFGDNIAGVKKVLAYLRAGEPDVS